MTDKEERILILTTKNKNGDCECVTQDGCHVNDSCAICNVGMTRQEAIEVMAKAIFEWQRPGCRGDVPIEDVWNNEQEGYEKLAEVALNALLKGVKK